MVHYICTGECKAVSNDQDATCSSPTCSRHDMKLEECLCEDGHHGRVPPEGMEEEVKPNDEPAVM